MEKFVILTLKRQGAEIEVVKELFCNEEKAVLECIKIFRSCGLQKVILVDQKISVRFKDTRICKCTNVQREMIGEWKGEPVYRDVCMDCKVVIDEDALIEHFADSKLEESLQ